jgi:hypothetical protein
MTRRTLATAAAVFFVLAAPATAQDKLTVKVEDAAPPKELSDAVRGLLDGKALSVSDGKGKLLCTVWPRKELPLKAVTDPTKVGPGYGGLEESVVLGAVRFPEEWRDYRKQRVKPGVYTMRLGIQPMDGDHMGTAPYNEFGLLVPAALDKTPDLLDAEALHNLSSKAAPRKHPAMVLLFPNLKPADKPVVESKPQEHWVLSYRVPFAGKGKGELGFSLVVVGHSMAE